MRKRILNGLGALSVALGLALSLVPAAFAVGTPAGTTVSNSATLDYRVGGLPQNPIVSNSAQFLVDNKLDLVVSTLDGAAVSVIPGATAQVLRYALVNTGNAVQDYALQALPAAGAFFGVTDNFDALNVAVYVDADADGLYTPGVDTAGFVDELAADAMLTIFIVADIPLGLADADGALYDLLAASAVGGAPGSQGALIGADDAAQADDPNLVQLVFADGAGSADAAADGAYSSRDAYQVVTANLLVTKTSTVINDPFNGAANPKAVPGALVRYSISVENTGSAGADLIALVDPIPVATSYATSSITLDGTPLSDGADADAADFGVSNAGAVTVQLGSIAPGGSVTVTFDVTID